MEENTGLNQVQDSNQEVANETNAEDENLFSDYLESTPAEETGETKPTESVKDVQENVQQTKQEENAETPAQQENTAPFLEIKYNKETRGLSQDEAREFAQKGMNYDHLNDKYNSLNDTLTKLARLNNMDVNQFLNSLNDTQVQYEESKEMESLKTKYPNSDEALLKELASKNVKERLADSLQKFESEKNEQVNAQELRAQRDIETLKTEFPDLKEIPNEVIDIIRNDKLDLVSAYYKYLHNQDAQKISEAEAKSKVDAQNEANKKKALGSTSNAGSDTGKDAFFVGLNSI